MSKVYIGDTGTAIVLDTLQNISTATLAAIEARKPNGQSVTWTAAVFETTKVRYVTVPGTFDMAGEWKLQAKVTTPAGSWLGEVASLLVYSPFS